MDSAPPNDLSSFSQWMILLRTHARIQRAKTLEAFTKSRLKTFTIIAFLGVYVAAAFFLLDRGFRFVANLPAAGNLIMDRLIHVVFFCFMVMLIFSSAVTAYISIYRGKDVPWLVGLPVDHRVTFLWKCFESALFSTWGLLIIIAPLLISFAKHREVTAFFYLKSVFALVPFLVICCSVGAIGLIVVWKWLNRRQFGVIVAVIALIVIASFARAALDDRAAFQENGLSAALTFQTVLGHTKVATNRLLPSTWLASSIVEWSHPFGAGRGWLSPTLLISNALFLPLLLAGLAKRWFYASWNQTIQSNAVSANSRLRSRLTGGSGDVMLRKFGVLTGILGRPMGAVAKKDLLTFIREPAQWAQFTLVFGLLAIYAAGLNRMHDSLGEPRDLYLVAFLNLAVSALALSTLTTRFVFPQFSQEGRNLWILAMSPIRLSGIVMQKFITSTIATGVAVAIILMISSSSLRFDTPDTIFFCTAIFLLAVGLNSLAVGLGVIFPDLNESNTAKIVSGFGGTLCLVTSFIYIIAFILTLVWVRSEIFYDNSIVPGWHATRKAAIGFSLAGTMTLLSLIPLIFAIKNLRLSTIER